MKRPRIRISLDLASTVEMYDSIIKSLKAQKARHDHLFEQYMGEIKLELAVPANRYSRWAGLITKLADEVRTGKLIDWDLIKTQTRFTVAIVRYNSAFQIPDAALANLEAHFDAVVETALRLETALLDRQKDIQEAKLLGHLDRIRVYQEWYPHDPMRREGHCVYCGLGLTAEDTFKDSCRLCHTIPTHRRPYLRIAQRIVQSTAPEPAIAEFKHLGTVSTTRHALPAEVAPASLPAATITPVRDLIMPGPSQKRVKKPLLPKGVASLLKRVDAQYKDDLDDLTPRGDDEPEAEDASNEEVSHD